MITFLLCECSNLLRFRGTERRRGLIRLRFWCPVCLIWRSVPCSAPGRHGHRRGGRGELNELLADLAAAYGDTVRAAEARLPDGRRLLVELRLGHTSADGRHDVPAAAVADGGGGVWAEMAWPDATLDIALIGSPA